MTVFNDLKFFRLKLNPFLFEPLVAYNLGRHLASPSIFNTNVGAPQEIMEFVRFDKLAALCFSLLLIVDYHCQASKIKRVIRRPSTRTTSHCSSAKKGLTPLLQAHIQNIVGGRVIE